MDNSSLIRLLGFPAALIHGDTMVLDRWLWLRRRLPRPRPGETLLDVGCGTGVFSAGAARRGYRVLGLNWDERDQALARRRAEYCGGSEACFEIQDIRFLSSRSDLQEGFSTVICLEVIEHLLDDLGLMRALAGCLRPGGRLLLTTPNLEHRPVSPGDAGPFPAEEDGGHVRKGYNQDALRELCRSAVLEPVAFSYCSGFLSQKITRLKRSLTRVSMAFGWFMVLPLRALPPILDPLLTPVLNWPWYSIGLEARKPVSPPAEKAGSTD